MISIRARLLLKFWLAAVASIIYAIWAYELFERAEEIGSAVGGAMSGMLAAAALAFGRSAWRRWKRYRIAPIVKVRTV